MSIAGDQLIGTELLGYRIDALIGRGGTGIVYRAYDLRLKRNVALKLVAPELSQNERFRERFLDESELAASLDHPNVIPIYNAGEHERQLYLAMRYVEGSDLKALLREGRLDPGRAIAICSQVAAALDAAHARGLVHRDVKPSNVLLDTQEHVYLADFGLSRRLAEQAPELEATLSLGRRPTSPPSRSRARRWTRRPTCTRSAACSTSASRAGRRIRASRSWPCSGRISTIRRRRRPDWKT